MPNLSKDASHAFWDNYDRKTLYRIVVALEKMEHWATDKDPEVNELVEELGNALDSNNNLEIYDENLFIRMLANIGSTRAMRILQAIDVACPRTAGSDGGAQQLLKYAEEISENDPTSSDGCYSQAFIKRNLVFERLQLISRVFSPNRLSLVIQALELANEA